MTTPPIDRDDRDDPFRVTDADVAAFCRGAALHLRATGRDSTALAFYAGAHAALLSETPTSAPDPGLDPEATAPLRALVAAGLRSVFAAFEAAADPRSRDKEENES